MTTTPATTASDTSPEDAVYEAVQALVINKGTTEADYKKAEYLAYRYMAFTIKRSAEFIKVNKNQIAKWRKEDPVFADAEELVSTPKRKELAKEVAGALFQQNLYLMMLSDGRILQKVQSEGGIDQLTPSEFKQFESLRKSYSAEQWKSILASGQATEGTTVNIQTIVDRRSISPDTSPSLPSGADVQIESGASSNGVAGPTQTKVIEGEAVESHS